MSRKLSGYLYFFFLLVLILPACRPVEPSGEMYFNLDSLFQAQAQLLIVSKAKLTKVASLGEKNATSAFRPDSLGWINEFGTLSELALINKPIYQGLYVVNDKPDSRSNLRVLSYTVKEDKKEEAPVSFVRIYYLGSLNNIKRIEGSYVEANELYGGTHILSVELQDVYNKKVITSYSIEGHQKMILADSVDFKIDGEIDIN